MSIPLYPLHYTRAGKLYMCSPQTGIDIECRNIPSAEAHKFFFFYTSHKYWVLTQYGLEKRILILDILLPISCEGQLSGQSKNSSNHRWKDHLLLTSIYATICIWGTLGENNVNWLKRQKSEKQCSLLQRKHAKLQFDLSAPGVKTELFSTAFSSQHRFFFFFLHLQ